MRWSSSRRATSVATVPIDLGWEALRAQHAELQITASANEPLWDGAPIDHEAVIDALVGVEHAEAIQGWS
jgi:hypothetical protein